MSEEALDRLAQEPIDDLDVALLTALREAANAVEPVPAGLQERLKFAVALDEVFAEVATMTRESVGLAGVRSQAQPTANQTLTFASERLTAMVSTRRVAGAVRLDGWIAPAAALRVVLRGAEAVYEVLADESGRFSFEDLPAGFAQLAFYESGSGPDALVITPMFEL